MTTPESQPNKAVPEWAAELFTRFLDHQEELARVLHLSIRGISMLRGRYQALKVLGEVEERADNEKELEHAIKERELAQREVDNDFPLLHEQATVALWSALEALVRSFAARWLQNGPDAWQADAIKKLRVRLGDYESLSPADRCLWVIDQLDQDVGGALRNGVNRFEALLQPFSLDGPLSDDDQKTLYELSQIRHVIVHRSGVADKKILDACPWLSLKVGDRVRVSRDMWRRYHDATAAYVLELIQRVRVRFGIGRYESETPKVGA